MISMKNLMTILAGAVMLMSTSCSKEKLKGEGPDITDIRSLSTFTEVELTGSNNATIVKDTEYKVVVTGHQNLVPAFETNVSSGVLRMKFKDKYHNIQNDNIKLEIHTPNLTYVGITGSGNLKIKGDFTGNMEGRITGSGEMTIDNGSFDKLDLEVTGSGNIKAAGSICKTGYARISGSGNIELRATDYLLADISGSGNIYYWGNPAKTDLKVTGSGKVSSRN